MGFKTIAEKGTLNSELFHNHHLSISFSLKHFHVTILDLRLNKYVYFKSFVSNSSSEAEQIVALNDLLTAEKKLSFEYKSVSCSYCSKGNSVVPKSLYEETLKTKYYDFNVINNNIKVNSNFLPNLNAHNVYGILPEFEELIIKFFPSVRFFHYSTVLIESMVTLHREHKHEQMFISLYNDYFDLIILKNGKLQIQNTYSCHAMEDVAYFMLFTAKELELSLESAVVNLYGNQNDLDKLIPIIEPYIINIELNNVSGDIEADFDVKVILEHPSLFNQYRCV